MLGPTTWAVEKRGSATVNVSGSRSTSSAAARPVTTNPPIAGTQATGASARRRARCGWGSPASSLSVMPAVTVATVLTGRAQIASSSIA